MDRKRYFASAETNLEVLDTNDYELLLKSGEVLCSELITDYPHKLPDALIFPVASAPPLWHLIDGVLQKIAAARDVDMPQSFPFVNLVPPVPTDRDTYSDVVAILSFMKEKARVQPILTQRAKEIMLSLKSSGSEKPSIVIIDDFISDQCSTIKTLSEAFGSPLPIYAFLSNTSKLEISQSIRNKVTIGIENIHSGDFNFTKSEHLGSEELKRDMQKIGKIISKKIQV